jgi:hypothetical protein
MVPHYSIYKKTIAIVTLKAGNTVCMCDLDHHHSIRHNFGTFVRTHCINQQAEISDSTGEMTKQNGSSSTEDRGFGT